MKYYLPTMSIFGLTNDPSVVTEKIFLYFVTSEYSQSTTFYGNIYSLRYLVFKYQDDLDTLKIEIQKALTEFYLKYFTNAEVNVNITKEKTLNVLFEVTTETEDGEINYLSETISLDGDSIQNFGLLLIRS